MVVSISLRNSLITLKSSIEIPPKNKILIINKKAKKGQKPKWLGCSFLAKVNQCLVVVKKAGELRLKSCLL